MILKNWRLAGKNYLAWELTGHNRNRRKSNYHNSSKMKKAELLMGRLISTLHFILTNISLTLVKGSGIELKNSIYIKINSHIMRIIWISPFPP
jgi:hypothetical protein